MRTLTVDTGRSHATIRSDLVNKEVRPLAGAKLRTGTGEYTQVLGKATWEIVIGKAAVLHLFI